MTAAEIAMKTAFDLAKSRIKYLYDRDLRTAILHTIYPEVPEPDVLNAAEEKLREHLRNLFN